MKTNNTHSVIIILLLIFSFQIQSIVAQQLHKLQAYELIERQLIATTHIEHFEKLQIQDFQGRIKPVHTLALDLVRKIYGKDDFKYTNQSNQQQKLNATQVFLGMQFKPDSWQLLPCIKIEKTVNDTLTNLIPISPKGYAKPAQFFDFNGTYVLKKLVADAYAKAEGKRNTLDKNIIKIDERLNIIWAIFNGQFLRVFPNPTDTNNKWFAPKENTHFIGDDQLVYDKLIPSYLNQLQTGITTKNWDDANETVAIINEFQKKNAPNFLLSEKKIGWEISYNKQHIFFRSMMAYSLIGLLLLIVGFSEIFYTKKWIQISGTIILSLLVLIFIYHGFGIALRWYISGHAPWSNGYEATIFISWVGLLAGIIFSTKTKLPAASTALIAVCLMGIAHGNLMNPEITNLVPVLKSYWLMIHVAVITGSYGFLTMGSLLAFIVLICISLMNTKQKAIIMPKIVELTRINEKTTTIGLFMLTIGTFLGGVWANESWGRYWGWDPKETWALISIIIYSFVLHIRIIFKNNHLYTYNVFSLFALGSLIMTFFGVNYYLSGLHSYAKGDPVPIPTWIYIVIPSLMVLAFISKIKWKKLKLIA
ncbi:cytochrome c biogenesis protein [Aquimarina agarilytica]|uniref:cytochrome c biogenesis protein n=1 Tax=Aquimarina agarilytica TaxID=1087449 RepID=UPI0002891AEA|nr:cytochrome c biogenesis protein CcsA [Aquimarina agarilytica]